MTDKKLYGDRDITAFPELYDKHIDAMTREGLHSKSDIAAELAHRDSRINALEGSLRGIMKVAMTTIAVAGAAVAAATLLWGALLWGALAVAPS